MPDERRNGQSPQPILLCAGTDPAAAPHLAEDAVAPPADRPTVVFVPPISGLPVLLVPPAAAA